MSEFNAHVGGAALGTQQGNPMDRVLGHLMGGQQGPAGLQSLVERLRQGGLGPQVDSWVADGPNDEVTPQQLEGALGLQQVDRLASDAGVERPGLLALLTRFLPMLVDGLSPRGRMPTQPEDMPQGGLGGILGSILGRLGGGGASGGGGGLGDILGGLLGGGGLGSLTGGQESGAPRHPGKGASYDDGAGMPRVGPGPVDDSAGPSGGNLGTGPMPWDTSGPLSGR